MMDFFRSPLLPGRFVDRPNRFLARCQLADGQLVEAFLPNPGRLWELLLPDAPVLLARRDRQPDSGRTTHTLAAALRDGAPILLHTHMTNQAARHLIEQDQVPGLEGARIVRAEAPVGRSRFDFLLHRRGRRILLEVKSVTLFGNDVAMFPDGVTARGRKHLLELAELRSRSLSTVVLFLVHTPRVRWFMPEFHTDLAFSRALLDVRRRVEIVPLAIQWTEKLELAGRPQLLEVPWAYLRREVRDRGAYVLLLRLADDRRLAVGSLGELHFPRGWYAYVGSAMANLSARVARHLRAGKRPHWHVDYLRAAADQALALPVRSSQRDECRLAAALGDVLQPCAPGFGASDCSCDTHLFYSPSRPLDDRAFHQTLQSFRMKRPDTGRARQAPRRSGR